MEIRAVIVDDDVAAVRHLRRMLERHSEMRVVAVCHSGAEAVEVIDRLRPDLLFIEVELPGPNGLQLLQRIDHQPIVVVVTALSRYGRAMLETEALDCLGKPVDEADVLRLVNRIRRLAQVMSRPPAREGA